jgi:hypothetical protein
MDSTMTIERTGQAFDLADAFQYGHTPWPDSEERSRGVGLGVQTRIPGRSVGAKGSCVVLDEYWGKRLGAERNGRIYRLSRREFVRRMAELNGSSVSATLHDSSLPKAHG